MKGYAMLLPYILLVLFSCKKDKAIVNETRMFAVGHSNGPVDSLKLNQITILASHNSYHLKTDSIAFKFMEVLQAANALPSGDNPLELDYIHLPLTQQLTDYHIRGLELDVWNDPTGGRYYHRGAYALLGYQSASYIPELNKPGFKIIHIPDFDFNPTNYTFVDALAEIKAWSDANPNHIPVFINVETEVETVGDMLPTLGNLARAAPFDATAADELDREIKAVFGSNLVNVITPDMVRGNYPTLQAAVLAGNWPNLGAARGKVVFIIDPDGNSGNVYKSGHASLAGRACFVYSNAGADDAAFLKYNEPTGGNLTQIQQLVSQGYIIRTMSDDATIEARSGDYSRMKAAFAGYAQIVSTDYYKPDYRAGTSGWSDYHVVLPGGGVARIDSISAGSQLGFGPIKE